MKLFPFAAMAAALFLSGCASLSKNECLNANWLTIGYEDGVQGRAPERIGKHRRACADYGITPDLRLYQQGRTEGLAQFCTTENGFNRGEKGYRYRGICPKDLEPLFLEGYTAGREIYKATEKLKKQSRELHAAERRLEELDKEIHKKEKALFADTTSPKNRKSLYLEIEELKEEFDFLKYECDELLNRKNAAEDDLQLLLDN